MPSALPQHSRHDTLLNIEQLNRTVTSVGTLLTSNRKLLRSVAVGGTLNQFIIPPPDMSWLFRVPLRTFCEVSDRRDGVLFYAVCADTDTTHRNTVQLNVKVEGTYGYHL